MFKDRHRLNFYVWITVAICAVIWAIVQLMTQYYYIPMPSPMRTWSQGWYEIYRGLCGIYVMAVVMIVVGRYMEARKRQQK